MGRKRKANEALETSARDVLQHWNDYYVSNDFGLGVQCCRCHKWRLTYQYQESREVPDYWNCTMWRMSKRKRGNCTVPSDLTEEDFAPEDYPPGTLVWAKMPGYDRWPAMVEDSPDTQEFFMINEKGEEEYHVTFFGQKPKRSWIPASHITEFDNPPPLTPSKKTKGLAALKKSIQQAEEAAELSIKERLKKYSFAVRYKGRWAKIKVKDNISLPPTYPRVKGLVKFEETRSSATSDNRDHQEILTPRRKTTNEIIKKVKMDQNSVEDSEQKQSFSSQSKNEESRNSIGNDVDVTKKEHADETHNRWSKYLIVQTTSTIVRSVVNQKVHHDHFYQPSINSRKIDTSSSDSTSSDDENKGASFEIYEGKYSRRNDNPSIGNGNENAAALKSLQVHNKRNGTHSTGTRNRNEKTPFKESSALECYQGSKYSRRNNIESIASGDKNEEDGALECNQVKKNSKNGTYSFVSGDGNEDLSSKCHQFNKNTKRNAPQSVSSDDETEEDGSSKCHQVNNNTKRNGPQSVSSDDETEEDRSSKCHQVNENTKRNSPQSVGSDDHETEEDDNNNCGRRNGIRLTAIGDGEEETVPEEDGELKRHKSHKNSRRNGIRSIGSGDENEEDGGSADDEASDDYDSEDDEVNDNEGNAGINGDSFEEQARDDLANSAPLLSDTEYSTSDEEPPEVKEYREFLSKEYPMFLPSGTPERQLVPTS